MFYCEKLNKELRFGDVIEGQYLYSLDLNDKSNLNDYKLRVFKYKYNVILTPCCSIRDKNIAISPLIPIKTSFFQNPFFEENLLRINEINPPHKYVPPNEWEKKSEEDKANILSQEPCYALTDLFIYDKNTIFEEYELTIYNPTTKEKVKKTTNYYMIDFKNMYNIKLTAANETDNYLQKAKVLELSITTRINLNHKIKAFYRIAQEDLL